MANSRKYTSDVWNYFKCKNPDDKTATCAICKSTISYKSTITNLKLHLKSKHIEAFSNLQSRQKVVACKCGQNNQVPQPSVTGAAAERSEEFTGKLLQTVEKHPELYQGGSSAGEKDQHWMDIATELGEGVRYCKEEWRCLRKLYQSYSKGNQASTSEMEEQMEQMSFLAPFIEQETFSESEPEDIENETDNDDPLDNKSLVFETITTPKRKYPLPVKRSRAESKNEDIDETPKKLFLLSLMPDVRQMNNEQMRKFKKRVLDLIDDVLNE